MERLDLLDLFGDGGFDLGASGYADSGSPNFGDLRPYWQVDTGAGASPEPGVPYWEISNSGVAVPAEVVPAGNSNPGGIEVVDVPEVTDVDFTSVGDTGGDLGSLFGQALNFANNLLGQTGPVIGVGGGGGVVLRQPSIVINARNCPVGYHQPKNYGKVTKDGRPYPGSNKTCTRNRHMNVLNPKALMRATRRMAGFHHFAVRIEKQISHALRKSGVRAPRRISGGRCGTCRKNPCGC